MNSEQIKLAEHYFNFKVLSDDGFYQAEGYILAGVIQNQVTFSKFLDCKKCFAVVSFDRVVEHAEWHENGSR